MKKSLFNVLELSGIIFCMAAVSLLRNVYIVLNKSAVGILFGSVNSSVWEQMKPIIICYLLYGIFELMASKPYFRRFVCAKAFGMYTAVLIYVLFSGIVPEEYSAPLTLFSLAGGFFISKMLTLWDKDISFMFPIACFMLLLIFVMYFSFSAFPPEIDLFRDKESGMYGIIPNYVDVGAGVLTQSNG